ncbi:MAG: hypothetical protein ACXWJJ_05650 [Ramlibacter sp.]
MQPPTVLPRELRLLAATLVLLAIAVSGPFVPQMRDYHAFADQQLRWGLPHALDVLSNLPFVAVGLACLAAVQRGARHLSPAERVLATLTAAGLLLTAAGSAWYHLWPDDARLVADRGSMAVAFAGVLGLAACRVSSRAGLALGALMLVAAPLSVLAWASTGNLWPWTVAQGGGMLVLLALAATRREAALPVRWDAVVGLYGAAKLLEMADHLVWSVTGGLVSGHSLKHVVAAAALLPVVAALLRIAGGRQNARELPARAA